MIAKILLKYYLKKKSNTIMALLLQTKEKRMKAENSRFI